MFPIRDHNPSGRTPFVTYVLMAANIGIFLSYAGLMDDARAINAFWFDWAMIPARVGDGQGLHTLMSSMFLHGGLMHLAGNMLFLWIFGDNVEDSMGHAKDRAGDVADSIAAMIDGLYIRQALGDRTPDGQGAAARVLSCLDTMLEAER